LSLVAAIVHRDGAPVERGLLGQMFAPVASRIPDGISIALDEGIGIGFGALHTTPEARLERQPATLPHLRVTLAFAGRIDNRGELHAKVGAGVLAEQTDVELVLRAYERFGDECVSHLVGDYSLVLWDGTRSRLMCAVDPLGQRSMYYSTSGGRFICASDIAQVLAHPGTSRRPDERTIARLLAKLPMPEAATLYEDVAQLGAGQVLLLTNRGLTVRRFWSPEDGPTIRYRYQNEYDAHFRDLFGDALTARLRSDRPVAIQVSGGIDSSAVFTGACAQLGSRASEWLRPYALVFPNQAACDERKYVDALESVTSVAIRRFEPDRCPAPPLGTVTRTWALPEPPTAAMYLEANEYARDQGCRVVLTGDGGDDWFAGNMCRYADLLRKGHVLKLIRQRRRDVRLLGQEASRRDLLDYALRPLLPMWLRRARSFVRRAQPPDYLHSNLAALAEPAAILTPKRAHRAEVDQMVEWACDGRARALAASFGAAFAGQQMERRSPLCDSRLVHFMLGVPPELRWGLLTKTLMRRALVLRLPPEIAQRADKADFSHVVLRSVVTNAAVLGDFSELERRHWVDGRRARALVAGYQAMVAAGDPRQFPLVWTVWFLFAIEEWAAWLADRAP
jgi:asparagine synthase (glutamine-hydrolysing)